MLTSIEEMFAKYSDALEKRKNYLHMVGNSFLEFEEALRYYNVLLPFQIPINGNSLKAAYPSFCFEDDDDDVEFFLSWEKYARKDWHIYFLCSSREGELARLAANQARFQVREFYCPYLPAFLDHIIKNLGLKGDL